MHTSTTAGLSCIVHVCKYLFFIQTIHIFLDKTHIFITAWNVWNMSDLLSEHLCAACFKAVIMILSNLFLLLWWRSAMYDYFEDTICELRVKWWHRGTCLLINCSFLHSTEHFVVKVSLCDYLCLSCVFSFLH